MLLNTSCLTATIFILNLEFSCAIHISTLLHVCRNSPLLAIEPRAPSE